MAKVTSKKVNPSGVKKTIKKEVPPESNKKAIHSENPDESLDKPIGWNFRLMDQAGSWPCTFKKLTKVREQLISCENKKYRELFNRRGHSHTMPADALCKTAQKRLEDLGLDSAALLHQLEIGPPPGRLWGIIEHNIFHLLWLDPKHTVYPMPR